MTGVPVAGHHASNVSSIPPLPVPSPLDIPYFNSINTAHLLSAIQQQRDSNVRNNSYLQKRVSLDILRAFDFTFPFLKSNVNIGCYRVQLAALFLVF